MIILGAGEFADIAFHYLAREGIYAQGFAVDKEYLKEATLNRLPVVDLDKLDNLTLKDSYILNAVAEIPARIRLFRWIREHGYIPWTYKHPHSFIDPQAAVGEGSFIFEDNTIQYKARIGQNCILWSGNHIGHSAKIGDHCFITSHVVVSGYCDIGERTYIGVNACIADNVTIGENSLIGMGAVVHKDLPGGKVYVGNPARELRDVGEEGTALPA